MLLLIMERLPQNNLMLQLVYSQVALLYCGIVATIPSVPGVSTKQNDKHTLVGPTVKSDKKTIPQKNLFQFSHELRKYANYVVVIIVYVNEEQKLNVSTV